MSVSIELTSSGPTGRLTPLAISPPAEPPEEAVMLFRRSERPVIIVRHGKYDIPVMHILLNDMALGKIRKEQSTEGKTVWFTSLHNPNFSRYAKNCGAMGIRVSNLSQLDGGMKEIFEHIGPAMLEIITDPELI